MNHAILSSSSSSPELVGAGESLKRSVLLGSRMTYSRLIGTLFLLGFLSYGVGFALVTSVTGTPDFLSTISAHQTTMVLGAFLMIPPLAKQAVDAGATNVGWAKALGSLAVQWNAMAYQIAEMALGLGGVFLCSLLFRTRLIPRFLAGWGVIGYAIFVAGAIAEIFGIHIGLIFSIPGGLFELALGIWLLIKGFQREAYGQDS